MASSASTEKKAPPRETWLYQPVVPDADAVRVAFVYPASYEIAMSSLGYLILFKALSSHPAIAATRVYADTLAQHRHTSFELMGFSFSFELDTVNILKSLEHFDIPLLAAERDRHHPLVFAGGPVPMSNPEPYAAFFDFFVIGEGEDMLPEVMHAYQRLRDVADRQTVLRRLAAEVPGVYVPSLYDVSYHGDDGPVRAIQPIFDDVPFPVQRRTLYDMDNAVAATPILTDKAVYANTYLIEVMRGCAHRCRFCLASYATLPARGAALAPLLEKVKEGLAHTHKLGLLGALISDHPQFPELCAYLEDEMDHREDIVVSASSLRADTLTPQIVRTFQKGKQRQITIAVESGSARLRRRINKNLSHAAIVEAADMVAAGGLKGLKVYGMVGLPDETEADVEALAALMRELRTRAPKLELVLGSSSFVPKAGTPFQWQPRLDNKATEARFGLLKKSLAKVCDFRPGSTKWDYFQAVLSRGDRRLAPLLLRFYALGGGLGSLNRAYKELQAEGAAHFPALDWYALRERPQDEVLPWEAIHLGVSKEILYKEGLAPPGWHAVPLVDEMPCQHDEAQSVPSVSVIHAPTLAAV
jgi:radical SAM superfamily enzyme YgiQ (UPF0313 family)